MDTIGTYELKTHLSDILGRVERGEQIVITRRGVPVARLVPANAETLAPAEVLRQMRELRARQQPIAWETLKKWRDEGRR